MTQEYTTGVARYREFSKPLRVCFYLSVGLAILVAVNYIFSLGISMVSWAYYYTLIGLLLPFVFLFFPSRKGNLSQIPWYDYIAAVLTFVIAIFFAFYASQFQEETAGAWQMHPTPLNFSFALILSLFVLESARRIGGWVFLVVTLLFGVYPLFSEVLPGLLKGVSFSLPTVVGHYAFGSDGLMGIPMKVVGEILIGFLIFAGLLVRTGAGEFFLNLAMSVAGHTRGGPAKVAVLGSALFGSLSGSIFSNIIGTGSVTIPTMKKIGYPAHYAGAIEACASTGGVLMPPVMGAVAFVMAAMTDIPYSTIIVAAFIPSILYYWGLLLQADAYAAKVGIRGLPREELPSFWQTLKQGWHFIFVLAFLVWGLIYMRWEALTPFYASGLLVLLAMIRRSTRLDGKKFVSIIEGAGKLLVETVGIILPLGLIIGGLLIGGVAHAFTASIVALSGGVPLFALLLGAIACYVLGMLGLTTPAYIFLAVTLAPALVATGFNTLAVHLFIIYYAMLAAITPPVAVGAFIAAGVAGASPMRTAWQAMRLGIVIYFIPFFFVYQPALILQGTPIEFLWSFITSVLGIVFIAAAVEGHLTKVGRVAMALRPFLLAAGVLLAMPGWESDVLGAGLAIVSIIPLLLSGSRRRINYIRSMLGRDDILNSGESVSSTEDKPL